MAKQKDGVNKSQAIRDILTKTPKMPVKEIVGTLGAQGVKVQPGLIYFIKGKMKGRRGRRRKLQGAVAAVGVPSGNGDPLSTILKVKKLAADVGGIKKLKALVEALSE